MRSKVNPIIAILFAALLLAPVSLAAKATADSAQIDATAGRCEVQPVAFEQAVRVAQQAANQQLYDDPLTQQRVTDTIEAIHNGDPLTDPQVATLEAYNSYMRTNLSADSNAIMDAARDEIEALGIAPFELDERIGELKTPADPRWDPFALEAEALFLSLPRGQATSIQTDRAIFTIGAITIIGIVSCDFKMQACAEDTVEQYEDCVEGRLCEDDECVDIECCNGKAQSDLKNCTITCGINGPDGDYGNCC